MAHGEGQTLGLTDEDRAQLRLHSNPLTADVYNREEVKPLIRFGEWEEPPPSTDDMHCEEIRQDGILLIECVTG